MSERERFEAWAESEGLNLARGTSYWYLADRTATAWDAWRYRAASSAAGVDGGKESMGEAEELSLRALYEDACIEANKNAQDAEILRTLIHRTHACDLKFDKAGKVRALHAIFKVDSQPGYGMTEGVRRYLGAFMEDTAIEQATKEKQS